MKTTDVVVRRANDADRPAIERLLDVAGLPLVGLDDVWFGWVADRGGTVVGTAALERYGSAPRPADHPRSVGRDDEPVYLLRSVAVDPVLQGMGIGGTLVEVALDGADGDAGRPATVAALTTSAVGYFDQFGFAQVERATLPADLAASAELTGACPRSARAYLRRGAPDH